MARNKKNDDIVTFIHDGRVVSNDPRFKPEEYEDYSERENTGDIDFKQPETVVESNSPVKDYSGMTVDELKDELKTRQEAGREIDTEGITKKSQLISALQADDVA